MLAFHFLALEKGQIHPGKKLLPPVPFNLILRTESENEQRLIGKVGDTSRGKDAAYTENQGANLGIRLTEDSGAFGMGGQAYPCPSVLGMCQALRLGHGLRFTWVCVLWS